MASYCGIINIVSELKEAGLPVIEDVLASSLTTYHIGGPIKSMLTITSHEQVIKMSEVFANSHFTDFDSDDFFVIGNGSNIIVNDEGFDGLFVKLAGAFAKVFEYKEVAGAEVPSYDLKVGAGMSLPQFARQSSSSGYLGCEFYVGIPGTIGGAVAMNAGGHGKQTSDVLISVDYMDTSDGELITLDNGDCGFGYRKSNFEATDLILSATYRCVYVPDGHGKDELDEIVKWRRKAQPGGRNIGSVFQNEENVSAGSLIEKCNLKGFRIGGAYVSEKHANFIQADEGAKATDVVALIDHVRKVVKEETGIELKNEVRYIGFNKRAR